MQKSSEPVNVTPDKRDLNQKSPAASLALTITATGLTVGLNTESDSKKLPVRIQAVAQSKTNEEAVVALDAVWLSILKKLQSFAKRPETLDGNDVRSTVSEEHTTFANGKNGKVLKIEDASVNQNLGTGFVVKLTTPEDDKDSNVSEGSRLEVSFYGGLSGLTLEQFNNYNSQTNKVGREPYKPYLMIYAFTLQKTNKSNWQVDLSFPAVDNPSINGPGFYYYSYSTDPVDIGSGFDSVARNANFVGQIVDQVSQAVNYVTQSAVPPGDYPKVSLYSHKDS